MFNPEAIIALICLIFSYFLSLILGNFAQAWLAQRWNAETGLTDQYRSLNPFNHMGVWMAIPIVLWIFNMAPVIMREPVPVAPERIQGEGRNFKVFFVSTISSWIHLLIAFASLLVMTFFFNAFLTDKYVDPKTLMHISGMVMFPFSHPLQLFTYNLSHVSSVTIILLFILLCLVFFNTAFAAFSLFFSAAYYVIQQVQTHFYSVQWDAYHYYVIQTALNMIILILGNPLYPFIKNTVSYAVSLCIGFY